MVPDPMVVFCRYCCYARAARFDYTTGAWLDYLCQQCGRDYEFLTPQEMHQRKLPEQAEAIAKALGPLSRAQAETQAQLIVEALQPKRRGRQVETELLGKRAGAKMLGVNRSKTLEALIRTGRIRTVKFNGKTMIQRSEIERIVAGGDAALAAPANSSAKQPRRARSRKSADGDPLDAWEPPERT